MLKVGFIGWRGMVGGVLLDRMRAEKDLGWLAVHFFSTSNPGGSAPRGGASAVLQDARDIDALASCQAVVSCQGASYTSEIFPALRASGWDGYWIDSSSALRLREDATLVLDPVNARQIRQQLAQGCRNFIGANCTVSLLLMAIGALFREGLVEWVSTMTYQAVSGAGARKLAELARQVRELGTAGTDLSSQRSSAIEIERALRDAQAAKTFPVSEIGAPLACNVLPWIDRAMDNGQTREEWKAGVEASKILGADPPLVIDGTCARVDALRCHSQALCIKLGHAVPLAQVRDILRSGNDWVRLIDNDREPTLQGLTPAAVSGKLDIRVGRLRQLAMGPEYLGAFTVGDQLLWGAAEPLRRMLGILRETCS